MAHRPTSVAAWMDAHVRAATEAATASKKGFGEVSWMDAFVRQMLDDNTGAAARLPHLMAPQATQLVDVHCAYVHGNAYQVNPGWAFFRTTEIGDICLISDFVSGGHLVARHALLLQMKVSESPLAPTLSGASSTKELLLYSAWPPFRWHAKKLRSCLKLSKHPSSGDLRHPLEIERKGSWINLERKGVDPREIGLFGFVSSEPLTPCELHQITTGFGELGHQGHLGEVFQQTLEHQRGPRLAAPSPLDTGWNKIIEEIVRGANCAKVPNTSQKSKQAARSSARGRREIAAVPTTPDVHAGDNLGDGDSNQLNAGGAEVDRFERGMLVIHSSARRHPAETRFFEGEFDANDL
jgi:hypothetical protein